MQISLLLTLFQPNASIIFKRYRNVIGAMVGSHLMEVAGVESWLIVQSEANRIEIC